MWWCILLALFVFSSPSSAQILVNEVYYDHPGTDDGFEFVELVNTGGATVCLDGYALEVRDDGDNEWATVWTASTDDSIGRLFVVGGEFVSPAADVVTTLRLQNGPDAIRLTFRGAGVDLVGYGDIDSPVLYEGQSAADVPPGHSLARMPDGSDTDNNAADFEAGDPSPGGLNRPEHDVAVAAGAGTRVRQATAAGAALIRVRLFNKGTNTVDSGRATVELADSAGGFVTRATQSNDAALAPLDSTDLVFDTVLSPGYHWLRASAQYSLDERDGNNALELFRRAGESPIVISEVMSHPADGCPEYIELFNAGHEPFDLANSWIRDAAHAPSAVTRSDVRLEPRDYVVLTSNASALRTWFSQLPAQKVIELDGAWPSLNHTGGNIADSVLVLDHFRLALDRIGYPPQPSTSKGTSLERLDLYPGVRRHTWVLSNDAGGGSPGRGFAMAILSPPTGRITAAPNPFDPAAGETLALTVPSRDGVARVIVSIFDIDGSRVADIGSSMDLPFVFLWNGRSDRGGLVAPGIYVAACEFYTTLAGARRVEKVVVGCAKRRRP